MRETMKTETPCEEVLRLVEEHCTPNGMGIHLIKKWLYDALEKEKRIANFEEEYKDACMEIKEISTKLKEAYQEIRELHQMIK